MPDRHQHCATGKNDRYSNIPATPGIPRQMAVGTGASRIGMMVCFPLKWPWDTPHAIAWINSLETLVVTSTPTPGARVPDVTVAIQFHSGVPSDFLTAICLTEADQPSVQEFAERRMQRALGKRNKTTALLCTVRGEFRYNTYRVESSNEA